MNNGYSETVDKILRKYGLLTRDCVGTMWSNGTKNWKSIKALGYRIERGIDNPDYDYVIISKEYSTLENILRALTITKVGCIIVFRADNREVKTINTWDIFTKLGKFYLYEYNNKILGVIFKGKEI